MNYYIAAPGLWQRARKQTDADRLQREFGDMFIPLLFHLTDESAVQLAAKKVDQR
jgi:hypothetical protein